MKKLMSSLLAGCMLTLSLNSVYAEVTSSIRITDATYSGGKVSVTAEISGAADDQIITVMSVGAASDASDEEDPVTAETNPETLDIVHIDQIDTPTMNEGTDGNKTTSFDFALKEGALTEEGSVPENKKYFVRVGGSGINEPAFIVIDFSKKDATTVSVTGNVGEHITEIKFTPIGSDGTAGTPVPVTITNGTFTVDLSKNTNYEVTATPENGYKVTIPTDSDIKTVEGKMMLNIEEANVIKANLSAEEDTGSGDTDETVKVSGTVDANITGLTFKSEGAADVPAVINNNAFEVDLVKGKTYTVVATPAAGYTIEIPEGSAITTDTDGKMVLTVNDAISTANLVSKEINVEDTVKVSGTVTDGIASISFTDSKGISHNATIENKAFEITLSKNETYTVTITPAAGYTVKIPDGSAITEANGKVTIEVKGDAITNANIEAVESAPEPTILYGDVNGDGTLDIADAALLLQYILAPNSVEVEEVEGKVHLKNAKVREGEAQLGVTADDVSMILKKFFTKDTDKPFKFPVERNK